MKKTTSIFLCFVLAVSAAIAMTACKKYTKKSAEQAMIDDIGGCSETYTGTISDESYASSDAAVSAVIANELCGTNTECRVEKAQKTAVTVEQYKKAIPEEYTQGATSVEKVKITYSRSEKNVADSSLNATDAGSADKKYTVVIYVINYDNYWKYFTPVLENAQTLTKSYYDSIFNTEKYRNCTMTSSMVEKMVGKSGGETVNITLKIEGESKYADNKIYLKTTATYSLMGMTNSSVSEIYIEDEGNGVLCYANDGTGWVSASLDSVGYVSIEDVMPFANNAYLDHSYFTKTSYGCEIERDKLEYYMNQAIKADNMLQMGLTIENGSIKYYVSDGVLSGLLSNIKMSGSITQDNINVTYSGTLDITCKCTDYGKTTVQRPEGIPA